MVSTGFLGACWVTYVLLFGCFWGSTYSELEPVPQKQPATAVQSHGIMAAPRPPTEPPRRWPARSRDPHPHLVVRKEKRWPRKSLTLYGPIRGPCWTAGGRLANLKGQRAEGCCFPLGGPSSAMYVKTLHWAYTSNQAVADPHASVPRPVWAPQKLDLSHS